MLVRTDLPLADQIVQVGHACIEAGWRFAPPLTPCHLVVLALPSQVTLAAAKQRITQRGIACVAFSEPDDAMGLTAMCTAPITGRDRAALRRYALWQPGRAPPDPRLP